MAGRAVVLLVLATAVFLSPGLILAPRDRSDVRVQWQCDPRQPCRVQPDIWFALDAAAPEVWDCPRCGQPAGLDGQNPPGRSRAEPYKSHLAYVKERRSEEDGAKILAEALEKLRQRRGR
jgi:hypothetical protein